MAIPIFWRLILSHAGILLLSGAACLYSIVQLGSLGGSARSALDMNYQTLAYQEALTDAFLSQIRYGGKYLITHTESRHKQLRQFKKDFLNYLSMLKRLENSESIGASLERIDRFHDQYHQLFDRETAYIHAHQSYAQTRYQQERDKIVESTLAELDVLKVQLRANLQQKLESIDRGARSARRIAMGTSLVAVLLGAILSLKVSSAIAVPVSPGPSRPQSTTAGPRIQALRITGARIMKRSWHELKLQGNRMSALTHRLYEGGSTARPAGKMRRPGKV